MADLATLQDEQLEGTWQGRQSRFKCKISKDEDNTWIVKARVRYTCMGFLVEVVAGKLQAREFIIFSTAREPPPDPELDKLEEEIKG